MLLKFPNGRRK
jgi:hypothetical protein